MPPYDFETFDFEKEKLIDLAYWFPLLQQGIKTCNSQIKVPETYIIKTDANLLNLFEPSIKSIEGYDKLLTDIDEAAQKVGYPFFLRSGYTSAKHDYNKSCLVNSSSDIQHSIRAIIEYGEMSSLIGFPIDTWVVRELLPITPYFYAFHGLPITSERRYFIRCGEVKYSIAYWNADAIMKPSKPDWLPLLNQSNTLTLEDEELLNTQTQTVACIFEDSDGWSVDWIKTDVGWYLIDMALAKRSWGYNKQSLNS